MLLLGALLTVTLAGKTKLAAESLEAFDGGEDFFSVLVTEIVLGRDFKRLL